MNLEYRQRKCWDRIRETMNLIEALWFPGAMLSQAVVRRFDDQVSVHANAGKETQVDVFCGKLETWASRELSRQKYGSAA